MPLFSSSAPSRKSPTFQNVLSMFFFQLTIHYLLPLWCSAFPTRGIKHHFPFLTGYLIICTLYFDFCLQCAQIAPWNPTTVFSAKSNSLIQVLLLCDSLPCFKNHLLFWSSQLISIMNQFQLFLEQNEILAFNLKALEFI